jgi:hypothetical protein
MDREERLAARAPSARAPSDFTAAVEVDKPIFFSVIITIAAFRSGAQLMLGQDILSSAAFEGALRAGTVAHASS